MHLIGQFFSFLNHLNFVNKMGKNWILFFASIHLAIFIWYTTSDIWQNAYVFVYVASIIIIGNLCLCYSSNDDGGGYITPKLYYLTFFLFIHISNDAMITFAVQKWSEFLQLYAKYFLLFRYCVYQFPMMDLDNSFQNAI